MELRNHPLLSYRELPSWPPVWVPVETGEGKTTLHGEVGVLKHTLSNALSRKCYMLIDHEMRCTSAVFFVPTYHFARRLLLH